MKKIVSALFLILTSFTFAWSQPDFIEGGFSKLAAQAKSSGKPLFIYFYSQDCQACVRMDSSWRNQEVMGYANARYVCGRSEVLSLEDGGVDMAIKFGIESLPSVLLFTKDGTAIYQIDGYLTAENLLGNLKTEWENAQKGASYCASHAKHWQPVPQRKMASCEVTYPEGYVFDVNKLNQQIAAEMGHKVNAAASPSDMATETLALQDARQLTPSKPNAQPAAARVTPVPPAPKEGMLVATRGSEGKAVSAPKKASTPAVDAAFAVQLAAFRDTQAADNFIQKWTDQKGGELYTLQTLVKGVKYYKVLSGKFSDAKSALSHKEKLGEGFILDLSQHK